MNVVAIVLMVSIGLAQLAFYLWLDLLLARQRAEWWKAAAMELQRQPKR